MAKHRRLNKSGATLIMTFMFLVTLAVMVGVFIMMVSVNTKNIGAQKDSAKAFYLSEAGVNKAVWYLTNMAPDNSTDGSWRTAPYPASPGDGSTDPQQESLGSGSYVIWVEDAGEHIQITARGYVNNATRTVRQEIILSGGASSVANTWQEI